MFRLSKAVAVALLFSSVAILANDGPVKVDPKIKGYQKVSGISGSISSVGSDTLNNLMALWSEGYGKTYPGVNVQVEGKGSSTAPPALIAGTSQLGPMSRPMKSEEIEAFEKKMGYAPTAIGVALDALAVFVNKDNPIVSMDMQQVDAIFSKTRKSGAAADITTWAQIDGKLPFASRPISLYGRNSASGTYGFFKEHALVKGDFKDQVKEQPGSSSVVQAITGDIAGIGYSGIGYVTSGVKTVSLAPKPGAAAVAATAENVINKTYPLGRMLFVYVNKKPGEPLPPITEQFLRYVLSKQGQEVVVKDGYIPLPAALLEKQLALLK